MCTLSYNEELEREIRNTKDGVRKRGRKKIQDVREKKLTRRYYKLTKNEKKRAVAERKCQMS